jgi:hypothetical protein
MLQVYFYTTISNKKKYDVVVRILLSMQRFRVQSSFQLLLPTKKMNEKYI